MARLCTLAAHRGGAQSRPQIVPLGNLGHDTLRIDHQFAGDSRVVGRAHDDGDARIGKVLYLSELVVDGRFHAALNPNREGSDV